MTQPQSSNVQARGCLDRLFLFGAALTVCVIGGAAFWFAADYHINPAWVFLTGNSILIVPLFIRDFRNHLKKPMFVTYLGGWAVAHGVVIVALMHWVPLGWWPICILVEGTVGLLIADYVFHVTPDDVDKQTKQMERP